MYIYIYIQNGAYTYIYIYIHICLHVHILRIAVLSYLEFVWSPVGVQGCRLPFLAVASGGRGVVTAAPKQSCPMFGWLVWSLDVSTYSLGRTVCVKSWTPGRRSRLRRLNSM